MYLKWGMFPEFGWSLVLLIPMFLISLWLARKVSKRIVWLLPALVLYVFVGWEFYGPLKWAFKVCFWLAVLVVIVTAVLTAFGRWDRTRFSKLPLYLMLLMLGTLFVLGIIGYVVETQADELRNFGWNGELISALIFGVAGLVLFFLKKLLGVIALTLAIVFLAMGIGGASLQTDKQESPGRPDGPVDVCLTVDGVNNRGDGKIQEDLPSGWTHVGSPSIRDCVTD